MPLREQILALEEMEEAARSIRQAPTLTREPDARYRTRSGPTQELELAGCAPAPLAGYLKALGVFRLIAEQVDAEVRGWWHDERFRLRTRLTREQIEEFFLHRYAPSPILSPWNGRAGFLEGGHGGLGSTRAGAVVIREIERSTSARFAMYRHVIQHARGNDHLRTLDEVRTRRAALAKRKKLNDEEKAELSELRRREKELKDSLLADLRANLPDTAIEWLDACVSIGSEAQSGFLLGTGGNEGSLDFSINHLSLLAGVLEPDSGRPSEGADALLRGALWDVPVPGCGAANPGMLGAGSVGGANMGSGFEGTGGENPWSAILMLEGAVLFATTLTGRHDATASGSVASPFTVLPLNAGHGGVSYNESSRPEIWAPIWDRPTSLQEIRALFGEGRLSVGRRRARNALDAARAITSLGTSRGVTSFQRFGFFERRGQGYFVTTPLWRQPSSRNPRADLIEDLERDGWLDNIRARARDKHAPARLVGLVKGLEDALLEMTGSRGGRQRTQEVLGALSGIMLYLARSPSAREKCRFLPQLGPGWAQEADDGSHGFAIALALAGLRRTLAPGRSSGAVAPLAAYIVQAREEYRRFSLLEMSGRVVWTRGTVESNLQRILERRLHEGTLAGMGDKPLGSASFAPLEAVFAWIAEPHVGGGMSSRIGSLLPGVSLISAGRADHRNGRSGLPVPQAYAVLKPLFCTDEQLRRVRTREGPVLAEGRTLPLPREVVRYLAAGRVDEALQRARQRLRGAGAPAPVAQLTPKHPYGPRLLAALMAPISDRALAAVLESVPTEPRRGTDSNPDPHHGN